MKPSGQTRRAAVITGLSRRRSVALAARGRHSTQIIPFGRNTGRRAGDRVAIQIEDLFVVVVVKWLAGFSPAARMAVWPA
jgi:hypothetical protein